MTRPVDGSRLSLSDAQSLLAAAEDALHGWYERQTTAVRTYVADGHEAIYFIDELVRGLHHLRSALIDEIRADEDERNERVDRLLAECRAARGAVSAAGADGVPEVAL